MEAMYQLLAYKKDELYGTSIDGFLAYDDVLIVSTDQKGKSVAIIFSAVKQAFYEAYPQIMLHILDRTKGEEKG